MDFYSLWFGSLATLNGFRWNIGCELVKGCASISDNMTPKFFFINISMGYRKAQNVILMSNSLKWAQKMFRKKLQGNLVFFGFHTSFLCFKPITFSEHFMSPFQRIWNQHKILVFFYCLLKICRGKLAPFANFECICSKSGTFSDI